MQSITSSRAMRGEKINYHLAAAFSHHQVIYARVDALYMMSLSQDIHQRKVVDFFAIIIVSKAGDIKLLRNSAVNSIFPTGIHC